MVMGLTGFAITIQRTEEIFNADRILSTYLLFAVVLVFILITGIYAIKVVKYFPDVLEEINHPVRLSFFSTFTVSLLLLNISFLEVSLCISKYLWLVSVAAHFLVTVTSLSIWVRQSKFEINHFHPGWFIPIVGNILVPISGVRHFPHELSWFFFSIGIIFLVLMFTIFMYRIIFHQPMPDKMLPTFSILIAPPAVGFVSYVSLNGEIDNFARILYYFALFMTIFLLAQIKLFL
jgi:tellurite resistance protein